MGITYIYDTREGYHRYDYLRSLEVVVPPAAEPVLPADLQAQTRINYTGDNQDSLLTVYIQAAREYCEEYLERTLAVQTLMMTLDSFPCDDGIIILRRPPVQEVLSITYVDTNGDTQTLNPTDPTYGYRVDLNPTEPRIAPIYQGQGWPTTRDEIATVRITYTAGYPIGGTEPSLFPARAKAAILLIAADLWNNRESQTEMSLYKNPTAEAMLSTLRTFA